MGQSQNQKETLWIHSYFRLDAVHTNTMLHQLYSDTTPRMKPEHPPCIVQTSQLYINPMTVGPNLT